MARHMLNNRSARHLLPALCLTAALLGPAAALANEPNGATIQWAQNILEDKGFYQGRASGKMDSATAAAISAFQRKAGLKATGRLDDQTVAKLMEGREQAKTVGNLADPTSRAKPTTPRLREEDVRPQAAPSAPSVSRAEGGDIDTIGANRTVTLPPSGTRTADSAAGEPVPQAAPRTAVEQPEAAPRTAVEAEGGAPAASEPFRLVAPDWLRAGLIGLAAALVLGIVGAWWLSGRTAGKRKSAKAAKGRPAARAEVRREPSLGGGAERGGGPILTAGTRSGGPGRGGLSASR
ncbi:MAG TPA: peptidoglycan-binding protein [Azospirillaceae bacterium]|nr:peptidoglycan-binding protein [Azospirillaceae bacterium]